MCNLFRKEDHKILKSVVPLLLQNLSYRILGTRNILCGNPVPGPGPMGNIIKKPTSMGIDTSWLTKVGHLFATGLWGASHVGLIIWMCWKGGDSFCGYNNQTNKFELRDHLSNQWMCQPFPHIQTPQKGHYFGEKIAQPSSLKNCINIRRITKTS